uniref:Circadian clock-controlled protein n=2 Tax=Lygus hesperus TaxID=30085 RepID=A0A146MC34_LYGHE
MKKEDSHSCLVFEMLSEPCTIFNMRVLVSSLALFLVYLSTAVCKLPPYIKPCKVDENIESCVLGQQETVIANVGNGDPAHKINSFNPMEVDELTVLDNGGSRAVAMNMTFKNMKIWGLPDGRLKKFWVTPRKKLEWIVDCPKGFKILSKYKVDGKVLLLPIKGDGDIEVFMDGVTLHFMIHIEVTKKGKREVITIKKTDMTHTVKNMTLHMDNLFNGDKLLGDELNLVMNENWMELNKQLGPPISKALALATKPILERIVSQASYNDIFPS